MANYTPNFIFELIHVKNKGFDPQQDPSEDPFGARVLREHVGFPPNRNRATYFMFASFLRPRPTVISCRIKPIHTLRHDGWELSELTGRRKRIDRPPKKTARGELEAPVEIDPKPPRVSTYPSGMPCPSRHRPFKILILGSSAESVGRGARLSAPGGRAEV